MSGTQQPPPALLVPHSPLHVPTGRQRRLCELRASLRCHLGPKHTTPAPARRRSLYRSLAYALLEHDDASAARRRSICGSRRLVWASLRRAPPLPISSSAQRRRPAPAVPPAPAPITYLAAILCNTRPATNVRTKGTGITRARLRARIGDHRQGKQVSSKLLPLQYPTNHLAPPLFVPCSSSTQTQWTPGALLSLRPYGI